MNRMHSFLPKDPHSFFLLTQSEKSREIFNVAECNLGEVKLEPMQSAAAVGLVRGKPCAGVRFYRVCCRGTCITF